MTAFGRTSKGWALLGAIAGLAGPIGPALADDASEAAEAADRRWMPSASFFTMGSADQRSAQMSTDVSVNSNPAPLDTDGHSLGLPWSVGGTLDIASPVVVDAPGRPRLFAHGDVGYTYDVEDPVATTGDPGSPPTFPPGLNSSVQILNRGASVRAEGKPLTFSGGFGTVFSFTAFERGFRLRPTLEWMYRRDTIKNTLGAGESVNAPATACAPCQTLFIKTQNEKGFHSLGPGVELEADVGRAGDFLIGFYGAFRAYYLVGDRKANIRSTGSWTRTDNGQPASRPDSIFVTQYEREPWHYRFGMGLRILWSPEE